MSEELEENRAENEKQLQLEIGRNLIFVYFYCLTNTDYKDSIIREKEKRIEATEETIADYEMTINRFRELLSSLQT